MRSGNWEGYEIKGQQPTFIDQRQAMFFTYSWNMGLKIFAQSTYTWNMARLPVGPGGTRSVAGYWPNWMAIPRGARHVEQAFAWLDYMSGVGVQAWFRNFPDLPANLKVPRDLLPAALVDGKGKAFAQDIMDFSALSSAALPRCGIRQCKTSPWISSDERSSRSCTRSQRPGAP
jgi:hypothetical protein